MADKNVRDELAELTEAVRKLRDREVAAEIAGLRAEVEKLRAEQGTHHCTGCKCMHIHWYPNTWTYPGTATYPHYVVTSGTSVVTTTTGAAGAGSTYMLSAGN